LFLGYGELLVRTIAAIRLRPTRFSPLLARGLLNRVVVLRLGTGADFRLPHRLSLLLLLLTHLLLPHLVLTVLILLPHLLFTHLLLAHLLLPHLVLLLAPALLFHLLLLLYLLLASALLFDLLLLHLLLPLTHFLLLPQILLLLRTVPVLLLRPHIRLRRRLLTPPLRLRVRWSGIWCSRIGRPKAAIGLGLANVGL
jgi:hypothetical protein